MASMKLRRLCDKGTSFSGYHWLYTNPSTRLDRKIGHIVEVYDMTNTRMKSKQTYSRTHHWIEGTENLVERIDILQLVENCAQEDGLIEIVENVIDENYTHDLGDGTIIVGKRILKTHNVINPDRHNVHLKRSVDIPYFELEYITKPNGEIDYDFWIRGKHLKFEDDSRTRFRCFVVKEWFKIEGRKSSEDKLTKIVYGYSTANHGYWPPKLRQLGEPKRGRRSRF